MRSEEVAEFINRYTENEGYIKEKKYHANDTQLKPYWVAIAHALDSMQRNFGKKIEEAVASKSIIFAQAGDKAREKDRKRIKKNVKYFLMSRYLVTTGDHYRLNKDDLQRLDEILDGRELKDDEDPYK